MRHGFNITQQEGNNIDGKLVVIRTLTTRVVQRHSGTIAELASFNSSIFRYLHALDERLQLAEHGNDRLRDDNSFLRDDNARLRRQLGAPPDSTTSEPLRGQDCVKPVQFADGDLDGHSDGGYNSRVTTPDPNPEQLVSETRRTPQTPEKIPTTKMKQPRSLLNKRKVHNLTSMLPPPMTQMPLLPLTDKELVV